MAETNKNLWAPWRMAYIRSLSDTDQGGCFLCRYATNPEEDATNHIIWRGPSCLTTFNTFPYSNGHLLVAPQAHLGDLEDLGADTLNELMTQVKHAKRLLTEATKAQGFNIGMNFGRCAGAGLPGHLHVHVVPRWEGDSNFMAVIGDVRVVSQSIEALHAEMKRIAAELGLPEVGG